MHLYSHLRICMDMDCETVAIDMYGYVWICMGIDMYGCVWICTDLVRDIYRL